MTPTIMQVVTLDDAPPDYGALVTVQFVLAVAASSIVAGAVVVVWVPPQLWPAWLGLVTFGVLLGWIDAATTWLPLLSTRILWLVTALGVLVAAVVPGEAAWWQTLLTSAIGAAALGLFFAAVWWWGRGALGFGDVRLAVALGAATGACSLPTTLAGALIGTVLAALWAVGRLIRQRREPFPYGPFLLVGAFLAPLVT